MAEQKRYWLIAIPRATNGANADDALAELNRVTMTQKELSAATHRFDMPELRVGNMDSLVTLSDDLKKVCLLCFLTLIFSPGNGVAVGVRREVWP